MKLTRNHFQKCLFHFVDPSLWSLVAFFSVLMFTFGIAVHMHGYSGGSFLYKLGLIMLLFVMYTWWTDIVHEGIIEGQDMSSVQTGLKIGINIGQKFNYCFNSYFFKKVTNLLKFLIKYLLKIKIIFFVIVIYYLIKYFTEFYTFSLAFCEDSQSNSGKNQSGINWEGLAWFVGINSGWCIFKIIGVKVIFGGIKNYWESFIEKSVPKKILSAEEREQLLQDELDKIVEISNKEQLLEIENKIQALKKMPDISEEGLYLNKDTLDVQAFFETLINHSKMSNSLKTINENLVNLEQNQIDFLVKNMVSNNIKFSEEHLLFFKDLYEKNVIEILVDRVIGQCETLIMLNTSSENQHKILTQKIIIDFNKYFWIKDGTFMGKTYKYMEIIYKNNPEMIKNIRPQFKEIMNQLKELCDPFL